jgi:hypothetical protein
MSELLIHPKADEYPLLAEDIASMAEDIAANGQRDPIVLDALGRLIDGRNRLAACKQAGVEPAFRTEDLSDEDDIEDYILSVNVEKRSLSSGQKAMFRACNLARQGKRKNGRWERGSINEDSRLSASAWKKQMEQAGLVIDVTARAAALGPEFQVFVDQPAKVKGGDLTLDAAHRIAQDFDAKAAMAEMAIWMPFTKVASELEQLSMDAAAATELPVVDAPLTKQHRNQLEETAKRFAAVASAIRSYAKEAK